MSTSIPFPTISSKCSGILPTRKPAHYDYPQNKYFEMIRETEPALISNAFLQDNFSSILFGIGYAFSFGRIWNSQILNGRSKKIPRFLERKLRKKGKRSTSEKAVIMSSGTLVSCFPIPSTNLALPGNLKSCFPATIDFSIMTRHTMNECFSIWKMKGVDGWEGNK